MQKNEVETQIRRSLSAPGNHDSKDLRRTASSGLIRVIPTTPRPVPVETVASNDGIEEAVDGTNLGFLLFCMSVYSTLGTKRFVAQSKFA